MPGRSTPREPTSSSPSPGQSLAPLPPGAHFAPAPLLYEELDEASFQRAATLSQGFIKGAVVKFLIDRRTQPAKIYFINGNFQDSNNSIPQYAQFHFYFAKNRLGISYSGDQFNQMTYFTNDLQKKLFIAGTLQKFEAITGQKTTPFYGIQFYPQDFISQKRCWKRSE